MKRSTNRILTTHTGALPRPDHVRELLAARNMDQPYDTAALDAAVSQAIRDVVKKQADVGLTVVNDGENSKYSFAGYIKERLAGFEMVGNVAVGGYQGTGGSREALDFPDYFARRPDLDVFTRNNSGPAKRLCCTGPIGWKDFDQVTTDLRNMKDALQGVDVEDVFISATSPGNIWVKTPDLHYGDAQTYLQAVADAMKKEYEAIVAAGFVLQVDCPDLASRSAPGAFNIKDFRSEISMAAEALNYAIRDIDPDMVRIHVCWGSDERPHHLDPELKDFVDILLGINANGMTIVAANGRHEHEWRVWEDVKLPEGKVIIPGVIDSTTNIVEHPEAVAERIERFVSVLGQENVIAGVDCGFQTTAGRDQVDPDVAWAKLRSLAEGAEIATKRLKG